MTAEVPRPTFTFKLAPSPFALALVQLVHELPVSSARVVNLTKLHKDKRGSVVYRAS